MPDFPPVHYKSPPGAAAPTIACGAHPLRIKHYSEEPGKVTCFACRKTAVFLGGQMFDEGVGTPTPLKEVIAADPELTELAARAAAHAERTAAWLRQQRNERGMYVIEEFIHHGEYRSTRRVEVYAITPLTVDCIIASSAYCYGSWLNPENPDHEKPRRAKLFNLVADLNNGRVNRDIGWSTFRLIEN